MGSIAKESRNVHIFGEFKGEKLLFTCNTKNSNLIFSPNKWLKNASVFFFFFFLKVIKREHYDN